MLLFQSFLNNLYGVFRCPRSPFKFFGAPKKQILGPLKCRFPHVSHQELQELHNPICVYPVKA